MKPSSEDTEAVPAEPVNATADTELPGDLGNDPTLAASDAGEKPSSPGPTASPRQFGRYLVVEQIGAGGMGVVYKGYDPELDRRVAIKVIRFLAQSGDGSLRMRREALSLARLTHPNIVAVYDVGLDEQRGLYITMEFVDGETVTDWLEREPRDWAEIVEVFRAAAAGLMAAHQAGIVHRDVKPDNLLITADGIVKVMDLGLAVALEAGAEARETLMDDVRELAESLRDDVSGEAFSTRLTQHGAAVGTPAYMAPEQFAGEGVDERTDQFGLCVGLYRALFGRPPFEGSNAAELCLAVHDEPHKPAAHDTHGVPQPIVDAVLRGLSPNKHRRFNTMAELGQALAHDPAEQTRRWAIVTGAAGFAILVAAAAYVGGQVGDEPVDRCAFSQGSSATEIQGLWTEAERQQVRAGYGEDSEFEARMQARVERLQDARRTSCLDSGPDDALTMARQTCFSMVEAELDAALELAITDSPASPAQSVAALPPADHIDRCLDEVRVAGALFESTDDEDAKRERAELIEAIEVVRASAELQDPAALGQALETRERAEALKWPVGVARATYAEALVRARLRDEAAVPVMRRAATLADGAGDDETRLEALTELAWTLGYHRRELPAARQALDGARGASLRLDTPPYAEARLEEVEGTLDLLEGDFEGAALRLTGALEAFEAMDQAAASARCASNLGNVHLLSDDPGRAVQAQRRSLAAFERLYPANAVQLAGPLNNLGVALVQDGKHKQALETHKRSLALRERHFGEESLEAANAHNGIGLAKLGLGDAEGSCEAFETSIAIRNGAGRSAGREADWAEALFGLARCTGDAEQRRSLAQDALGRYAALPDQAAATKAVRAFLAELAPSDDASDSAQPD